MANSPHAVKALTSALKTYLATQIPSLSVSEEFPSSNIKLVYPALTIFSGEPKYMALQPYRVGNLTAPGVDKLTTETLVVGEFDLKFQLDLWCSDKVSRDLLIGTLFATLNPNINPMGLRLQLADYFGDWAQFDFNGYQIVDDEAAAQRREWRVKFDLLANCRAILAQTSYAMITLEETIVTPDNI